MMYLNRGCALAFSLFWVVNNNVTVAGLQSFKFPCKTLFLARGEGDYSFCRLRDSSLRQEKENPARSSEQLREKLVSLGGDNLKIKGANEEEIKNEDASILPNLGIIPNGSATHNTNTTAPIACDARRKKMGLMWCAETFCKDAVRERVRGNHNQIILDGPATGQVAYYWKPDDNPSVKANGKGVIVDDEVMTEPSVLLLVKPNDNDLVKVAADAVEQLTDESDKIHVSLDSGLAGELKLQHGVDNERIHLFEPKGTAGYEGSHIDTAHKRMKDFTGVPEDISLPYDLICTLGGDGLLIHASMLFQGPCPPIISCAGGSLGFLTQFSKEEMVNALRIALGLSNEGRKANSDKSPPPAWGGYEMDSVFPPNMHSYPYEPLQKRLVRPETPRFSLDLGDRICLSIRMRLDCRIFNPEGVVRARFNVLNEVVIDRGSSPYLAALECFCDDVHLTTVQADGVIFATPTGSTAYSMAAGGSVVHPAVPCILVTPICPHVLSFRSMVFPDHVVLRCYVPRDARADAAVAFDGRYRRELHRGDSLQIQMSAYPVPTLNRADHSSDWLDSLKRSFNFNTRPRQKPL